MYWRSHDPLVTFDLRSNSGHSKGFKLFAHFYVLRITSGLSRTDHICQGDHCILGTKVTTVS